MVALRRSALGLLKRGSLLEQFCHSRTPSTLRVLSLGAYRIPSETAFSFHLGSYASFGGPFLEGSAVLVNLGLAPDSSRFIQRSGVQAEDRSPSAPSRVTANLRR